MSEQTVFSNTGNVVTPVKTIRTKIELFSLLPQCPYCLYEGNLNEYLLVNKKGVSKKQFQCPRCKLIMRKKTLFFAKTCSIQEYAQWVYDIKLYDIDHRLKWQSIKQWLKSHGASNAFWSAYYEVKQKDLEHKGRDWQDDQSRLLPPTDAEIEKKYSEYESAN